MRTAVSTEAENNSSQDVFEEHNLEVDQIYADIGGLWKNYEGHFSPMTDRTIKQKLTRLNYLHGQESDVVLAVCDQMSAVAKEMQSAAEDLDGLLEHFESIG